MHPELQGRLQDRLQFGTLRIVRFAIHSGTLAAGGAGARQVQDREAEPCLWPTQGQSGKRSYAVATGCLTAPKLGLGAAQQGGGCGGTGGIAHTNRDGHHISRRRATIAHP